MVLRSQLENFSPFWSKFCHIWDQCKSSEKIVGLYVGEGGMASWQLRMGLSTLKIATTGPVVGPIFPPPHTMFAHAVLCSQFLCRPEPSLLSSYYIWYWMTYYTWILVISATDGTSWSTEFILTRSNQALPHKDGYHRDTTNRTHAYNDENNKSCRHQHLTSWVLRSSEGTTICHNTGTIWILLKWQIYVQLFPGQRGPGTIGHT